jgi:hypothetical protein
MSQTSKAIPFAKNSIAGTIMMFLGILDFWNNKNFRMLFAFVFAEMLIPNVALSEFKPFSALQKSSVEVRVENILNVLRPEEKYKNLETYERVNLFYSTAGIIVERFCTKIASNNLSVSYPKWFDPIGSNIGINELRSPSTNTSSSRQLRFLSWSLVGLMADDEYPCEVAEFFYKSAKILN